MDTVKMEHVFDLYTKNQVLPLKLLMLFKQDKRDLRKAAAFNHPSEKILLARLNKVGLIAKILDLPEEDISHLLERNHLLDPDHLFDKGLHAS